MLENSKLLNDSWLRWGAKTKEEAEIMIMGIPFDNAVSFNKGAAKAPEMLRNLSVELSDVAEGFTIIKDDLLYDVGDIPVDLQWDRYFSKVREEAYNLMRTDKFTLFIGGDHSVTIPLHEAFGKYQREKNPEAKVGIIHFDAHFDLCDKYDGHKWSHACTEARALENVISPEDLFFVGVRVAENSEVEFIAQNPQIGYIKAQDVYRNGVQYTFDKLKERFGKYDAIYLTLDIDVLDPAFAPGTGTPVAGGLTSRELIELFAMIIRQLPVKSMDVVEVAPDLDVNNITSWAALRIIHELFSKYSEEQQMYHK